MWEETKGGTQPQNRKGGSLTKKLKGKAKAAGGAVAKRVRKAGGGDPDGRSSRREGYQSWKD